MGGLQLSSGVTQANAVVIEPFVPLQHWLQFYPHIGGHQRCHYSSYKRLWLVLFDIKSYMVIKLHYGDPIQYRAPSIVRSEGFHRDFSGRNRSVYSQSFEGIVAGQIFFVGYLSLVPWWIFPRLAALPHSIKIRKELDWHDLLEDQAEARVAHTRRWCSFIFLCMLLVQMMPP